MRSSLLAAFVGGSAGSAVSEAASTALADGGLAVDGTWGTEEMCTMWACVHLYHKDAETPYGDLYIGGGSEDGRDADIVRMLGLKDGGLVVAAKEYKPSVQVYTKTAVHDPSTCPPRAGRTQSPGFCSFGVLEVDGSAPIDRHSTVMGLSELDGGDVQVDMSTGFSYYFNASTMEAGGGTPYRAEKRMAVSTALADGGLAVDGSHAGGQKCLYWACIHLYHKDAETPYGDLYFGANGDYDVVAEVKHMLGLEDGSLVVAVDELGPRVQVYPKTVVQDSSTCPLVQDIYPKTVDQGVGYCSFGVLEVGGDRSSSVSGLSELENGDLRVDMSTVHGVGYSYYFNASTIGDLEQQAYNCGGEWIGCAGGGTPYRVEKMMLRLV